MGRDATIKDSGTTNLLMYICSEIHCILPTSYLERKIILRLVSHVLPFSKVPVLIILVIGRGEGSELHQKCNPLQSRHGMTCSM